MILIFDGSNIVKRAQFATPPMSTSYGLPTNTIKGTVNIVGALLRKYQPTHAVFVLDHPAKGTFRHLMYPQYKSGRSTNQEASEALSLQMPYIRKMLKAMGVLVVCKKGIEADDIVGTIAAMPDGPKRRCIVSQDKDFAQLLTNNVKLLRYKDKEYTEIGKKECVDVFGVKPKRIIDYLMLIGDGVDAIPGVAGVGPKRASHILNEVPLKRYMESSVSASVKDKIRNAEEQFKLTRNLVTIRTDIIPITANDIKLREPDDNKLIALCDQLEARGLYKSITTYLNS